MSERPRIFLDNTGIQESYVQAQYTFHAQILGVVGNYAGQWGRPELTQMVPATRENQLSFARFLHHNTEYVMDEFSSLGLSDEDLHNLIYLSQQRWKLRNQEKSEFEELPSIQNVYSTTVEKISTQVEEAVGDYKSDEKVELSASLVQPADIHDLNHIIATVVFDDTMPKGFTTELRRMSHTMSYMSKLLRALCDKHPTLLSTANRMCVGIASEWHEYISHLHRSTDNERAKSALLEAKSLFGSILSKTETESIDIMDFFASQEEYFKAAAHRHDEAKQLHLELQDKRESVGGKRDNRIQADRGKLITLMRNVVEDAVIHGDYPENTVHITIELDEEPDTGILLVKVSNPVYTTLETAAELCQRLGNERVILNNEGEVETLSLDDTTGPYKLHGLGKMSVALTVRQALTQAGIPLEQQFEYMKHHWSYRAREEEEHGSKQWFDIQCTVPLAHAA